MLNGGGVGQDNLVKGALDFPDDERSKRILSVDYTKRSQIKYHNNCYSNFMKAVKRHQAKSRSHSSIGEDVFECETTAMFEALVHLTKTYVLSVTEKLKRSSKKNIIKLYVIREKPCAQRLLNAAW